MSNFCQAASSRHFGCGDLPMMHKGIHLRTKRNCQGPLGLGIVAPRYGTDPALSLRVNLLL